MRERDMVIGNVVEEVNLIFLEEQPSGDRVYGSITPSLIEEAAILVEPVEVIRVGLGSKPIEIPNFEVGPLGEKNGISKISPRAAWSCRTYEVAVIVRLSAIITQKFHAIVFGDMFRMIVFKGLDAVP